MINNFELTAKQFARSVMISSVVEMNIWNFGRFIAIREIKLKRNNREIAYGEYTLVKRICAHLFPFKKIKKKERKKENVMIFFRCII